MMNDGRMMDGFKSNQDSWFQTTPIETENIHDTGSFTKPTKTEASAGLSSSLDITGALFGGHSWSGSWQNLGQVP